MSVPVYPLPGSLKDKFKTISKEKNNFNSSIDKSNKTIYKNNQNTKLKESINIANAKPPIAHAAIRIASESPSAIIMPNNPVPIK